VAQLLAEIQRVATTSQFNGQNILDGTFTAAQFQVGANANQTIAASTDNTQTSALGSYQVASNSISTVAGKNSAISLIDRCAKSGQHDTRQHGSFAKPLCQRGVQSVCIVREAFFFT
jgi:flagellin-like hook-associated protein FlgL